MNEIKIFAGSSGKEFTKRMCKYLHIDVSPTEVIHFSEGNTYVKIGEHVRGKEVYIVQSIGIDANNEFVELLFWLDAFKRSGAGYVTAVIPYFSYAKGNKKDEPRVSIRARVCAECIELAGADRIITMDLHAAQIQGFFKKPVDHLYARPLLAEYIKILKIDDPVIVAPDAGFAKNAHKFASYLNYPVAIGDKIREDIDGDPTILEIIGDIKGKNAIIVDDFCISAGTMIELVNQLKTKGARKVYGCLSHLPLSEKGAERIQKSDLEMLISTDSIHNPRVLDRSKIKILSVAPLFAEVIQRMQMRTSISDLFDKIDKNIFDASI